MLAKTAVRTEVGEKAKGDSAPGLRVICESESEDSRPTTSLLRNASPRRDPEVVDIG